MATNNANRNMAIPEVQPEHKEYWKACEQGKLLLKYCESCDKHHYYPRMICPFCMSDETVWKEARGTGIIYTFSVMRRAKPAPYAIAYVELAEGPRMMTNIVRCDFDTLEIGQPVNVVFEQTGDQERTGPYVPCFTPA